MAETKEYLIEPLEDGSIMISEEVIASVAAMAVREVEGVYGLTTGNGLDLLSLLNIKNLRKGIRVTPGEGTMEIACNLIVKMGTSVMDVAKKVQEKIVSEVESMTGVRPTRVNVNVCGVAVPKNKE